jgi:hypothetical protein
MPRSGSFCALLCPVLLPPFIQRWIVSNCSAMLAQ